MTADDLEKAWLACIDRFKSNLQAKAALLAATGVKFPGKVAEEKLPAAHAALQKLLTEDAAPRVRERPQVSAFEKFNAMASAIYSRHGQHR